MSTKPLIDPVHAHALRAAAAVTGRRPRGFFRNAALVVGAVALLGVDVAPAAHANTGATATASIDDDSGARLVHQAKGCFSWGPPAPPVFCMQEVTS